jgi:hypothetical protein
MAITRRTFLGAAVALIAGMTGLVALGPTDPVEAAPNAQRAVITGVALPDASGGAVWRQRETGRIRTLVVEVGNMKRVAGKTVHVEVGGRPVGRMAVNRQGAARLELSTANGQWVPESVAGQRIVIKFGDTILAGGAFPAQ